MQYQQQISDMNFEMLKRQYEMIQKMYTEKRMLLHDSVHQDVLILEYLQDRKYEEAQTYFEKKIAATKKRSRNRYTGIEVLNLMLNYEIEQAEEKAINVDCAVEVYHCPVDETELCIIIGNLFDNAIEAVKDLPDEQRQIDFAIQNPNCIFRIEKWYLNICCYQIYHTYFQDSLPESFLQKQAFLEEVEIPHFHVLFFQYQLHFRTSQFSLHTTHHSVQFP